MSRKAYIYHYLYKTTCKITGKFYVGMHSTSNLNDGYIGSGKLLWYSIKKHGKENHEKEILEFFSSRKDLGKREKEIVNEDFLNDPFCMNIQPGGEFRSIGFRHSEETKKKMSKIQKTIQNDPTIKAKKIKALTGKKRTLEQRKKMSESLTGRKFSEDHIKKITKASSTRSKETRKKLSDARKKWKRSPENIEKQRQTRASRYGFKIQQFTKDGIFLREWNSLSDLKKDHPDWYNNVAQVIYKSNLKTAKGYVWKRKN